MTVTPNLNITLLDQSQAQKEVTINQALVRLDVLCNATVVDKDLSTPPTTPAANALYIVAASATGAWSGHTNALTYFEQVWLFITPQSGTRVWVSDEERYYQYNGTSWAVTTSDKAAKLLINQTTDDGQNKLQVTGSVGIGVSTATASAALEVVSTTQGILFPRMTTTQKNAISSPAAGLVVYDTTLGKLCVRTASAWQTITSV